VKIIELGLVLTVRDCIFKRFFDFIFSLLGLLVAFPVILVSYAIASVEVQGNGLFVQTRVGRNGVLFRVYKIKTMKDLKGDAFRSPITAQVVSEITQCGSLFRRYKIDELPQLWNVMIGDMSFVGPRPDVPGYADLLQGDDRVVLEVRPGITGPASLMYKDEESVLARQSDPKKYNDDFIWPNKIRLNKEYIEKYSFSKDIFYIWKTIVG